MPVPSGQDGLWEWISTLYRQPGVEAAALRLQDERGVDVCVLLFACWLGVRGRSPGPDEACAMRREAASWAQGAVRPLRAARRFLRRGRSAVHDARPDQVAGLARRLAELELAAERLELEALSSLASALPPATTSASVALPRAILALTGLDPRTVADVRTIQAAARAQGCVTQT